MPDETNKGTGKDARAQRLAEALRQNLKRRKAQARARARQGSEPETSNPYSKGRVEPEKREP